MEKKNNIVLKVIGGLGLFLLAFGLSYALFTVTLNGTKKVKLKTGKLELQLLDENDNPIYITNQNNTTSYEINLDNQVPISDEDGLSTQGFTFKLDNTGSIDARYAIYLDDVALDIGEERIADTYVKYSLTKNNTESSPALLSTTVIENERELDSGIIEEDETNTYTLRIWIDEEATNAAMDKVFNATLRVEGIQYVTPPNPFGSGTMAATLYSKGIVGEYNTTTNRVPSGFDSAKEESGLYKYTDDQNTITYAYRGNPTDNYVTFAGQTWRILRIQDDGAVKLIRTQALNYENSAYDDGSITNNNTTYRRVQYNKQYNNDNYSKYHGSNIEGYVIAWYTSEMSTYANKLADNDYCSDRYEPSEPSPVKTALFSNYNHLYGMYNRLDIGDWNGQSEPDISTFSWAPSITCATADATNTKAALITADEYILAGGGASNAIINHYLNMEYSYWTMSPTGFDGKAMSYSTDGNGYICDSDVESHAGVVPVITLKANNIIASGNGTSEHPYTIG